MGVCLWEAITLERLFDGDHPSIIAAKVASNLVEAPSKYRELPSELEAVVMRALAAAPADRYPTASAMAQALERAVKPASNGVTARWVEARGGTALIEKRERLAAIEASATDIPIGRDASAPSLPAVEPTHTAFGPKSEVMTKVEGTPAPKRAPERTRLVLGLTVAIGLAALAIVVGLADLWASKRSEDSTAIPPAIASSVYVEPPSTEIPVPPPVDELDIVADADAAAANPLLGHRKGVHRVAPHPTGTSSGPASKDCNPPYELDAQGVRHYKKECFSP